MAASDDSPISGPGPGEGASVRRTPVLTEATPKDEIEDAVEVPVTETAAPAGTSGSAPESAPAAEDAAGTDRAAETPAAAAAEPEAVKPSEPETVALAAAAGAAAGAAAAGAAGGASAAQAAPAAPPARGGSGFGRVVTVGVAAIIGGVVALVAQPYLAPYLGAPVGVDLAAVNTLSARVTKLESATLQTDANTRAIATLEKALAAQPAAAPAAAAPAGGGSPSADVTSRLGELAGRVEALTGQGDVLTRLTGELGVHAGDLSAVKTRLEAMATTIATTAGDVTALKQQIETLSASDTATAEKIAGLQAALVAADGRLGAVAGVAAGLQARMETIEGTKGGALGDRNLAATALALTAFAQDLQAGLPFAAPLATLKPVLLEPVPAGIAASAATGLPTLPALRAAFEAMAGDLDIAVTRAEGGGDVMNRLLASARTLVRVRSTEPGETPPPANPVEVIRAALAVGDLPAALAAAEALPPQTAALAGAWTGQLKARVEASAFLTAASGQFLARLAAAGN